MESLSMFGVSKWDCIVQILSWCSSMLDCVGRLPVFAPRPFVPEVHTDHHGCYARTVWEFSLKSASWLRAPPAPVTKRPQVLLRGEGFEHVEASNIYQATYGGCETAVH